MHFQFETNLRYRAAQKMALKQMKKNEKLGEKMNPQELDMILSEHSEAIKVELGVLEIPTDQIIGVADSTGRNLYAASFMPVSAANSSYAEQWRELCEEYRRDNEFLSPLYCYEYMGKFFIIDGKKRVSVLKHLGVPMAKSYVVRIVPAMSEEKHVQLYYEFLKAFELTKLYQVCFSRFGSFEKLQKAMGHDSNQKWSDEERSLVMQSLRHIGPALEAAFGSYLNVTTADALLVLLEEHTFEQIRKMSFAGLTDCIQRNWKKLYSICHPDIELGEDDAMKEAS